MKALLQIAGSGEVATFDVPEPEVQAGGILVRTGFSALSAGTERAAQAEAGKSLLSRAKARPDLVKQVLDAARIEGVVATYRRVTSRLESLSPLGYSCAGTVIGVGEGVRDFTIGDRVACAGGGYANHSEVNFVPCNLAARVPQGVGLDAASLTTIGAIALQGVRQAQLTMGETVAIIGVGLIGALTIQLVKAAGCRAIAIDLDEDRARRAIELGADVALSAADENLGRRVTEFTQYGVDAVIITAATPSSGPIETAAAIARDRGRIVIVGDVGLGASRRNVYHKELSITMSRSYGPGRYDPRYEHEGIDYPIGYVRWTEKRNMEAFLGFLSSGVIKVDLLIQKRFSVLQGDLAYAALKSLSAYTVLIEYPCAAVSRPKEDPSPLRPTRSRTNETKLRVGCIGAGGFAKGTIFPALRALKSVTLEAVATSSGVASESVRRAFGFETAQTSKELISDEKVDAVFILSRHDSHARYVVASLTQHKPVFVEKPLAINRKELEDVRSAVEIEQRHGNTPFVMVGFNRRFAPMTRELKQFFVDRDEPMVMNIRVNAGFLPLDNWTQHKSGGGRIVGEMCHFVDWARAVIGSPIVTVSACALPNLSRYNGDNVSARLSFQDGSIANLCYLANGDKAVGKEFFEVFCGGRVARLDDFSTLELATNGKARRLNKKQDKGHQEELRLAVEAMNLGNEAPIPFSEISEVSEATFAIVDSVCTESAIQVSAESLARVAVGA